MNTRTRTAVTAAKLAAVAVVTVLLFGLVLNAMRNPVDSATREYSADFTDVSGLSVNGDVRFKGLRIGKIDSIDLRRKDGQAIARVGFSMDDGYTLTGGSRLAVKYQNLTGVRYLDLTQPDDPGTEVSHLPVDATSSSFDITELFNGLQPVLATMRTEEIDEFTENALLLLQGDGQGLAPMLASAERLASYAEDRQKVISILAENMGRVADTFGGRSEYVMGFLKAVQVPIGNAFAVLEEFPKTASAGPAFLGPVDGLLESIGLNENFDVETLLRQTFPSAGAMLESFRAVPAVAAGLEVSSSPNRACSNGRAQLPTDVRVLLSGSEVVLCSR
ncbi:MAG: MlaD family protein [Gordonia sp. (in: high G+C Gram-positive bacteria)]|uniref:MlaD family protein n=1 Tax=Gordonia sp. (in: high G+C Gram-positive bacteria) TaxID=84139 RepID=UPI003BB5A1F8